MQYLKDAMAEEMTRSDPEVKAIKGKHLATVETMTNNRSKNMTGAKYKEWQCSMSANYGGKASRRP